MIALAPRHHSETDISAVVAAYEAARRAHAEFRPCPWAVLVITAAPDAAHPHEEWLPRSEERRLLRLAADHLAARDDLELALAEHCEPVVSGPWEYSLDPDGAGLRVVRIDEGRHA